MKSFILFAFLLLFNMEALSANVDIDTIETQIKEFCDYIIPSAEWTEQFQDCYSSSPLLECKQNLAASVPANVPASNPIMDALVAELVFCSTATECYEGETEGDCDDRHKESAQCVLEKLQSAKKRYCSHPNFPSQ